MLYHLLVLLRAGGVDIAGASRKATHVRCSHSSRSTSSASASNRLARHLKDNLAIHNPELGVLRAVHPVIPKDAIKIKLNALQ